MFSSPLHRLLRNRCAKGPLFFIFYVHCFCFINSGFLLEDYPYRWYMFLHSVSLFSFLWYGALVAAYSSHLWLGQCRPGIYRLLDEYSGSIIEWRWWQAWNSSPIYPCEAYSVSPAKYQWVLICDFPRARASTRHVGYDESEIVYSS